MPFGPSHSILRQVATWTMNGFFKEVLVEGAENVPTDGPVIICSTHWNMIVDVSFIGIHCLCLWVMCLSCYKELTTVLSWSLLSHVRACLLFALNDDYLKWIGNGNHPSTFIIISSIARNTIMLLPSQENVALVS